MKHLTVVLASVLCIGNFFSAGSVSAMPVAENTRPSFVRVSKRTLNHQVRATWRHLQSKTKGF